MAKLSVLSGLVFVCELALVSSVKPGSDAQLILEQSTTISALFRSLLALFFEPETCYNKIECFSNKAPYGLPTRTAPPPLNPTRVCTDVVFNSAQVKNLNITIYPDISRELKDVYNPNLTTYFICHGYINTADDFWVRDMSDALLSRGPANVFIVDWAKGANGHSYFQSASNTRVVAAVLDLLIEFLRSLGADIAQFHLIGHSLGAQVVAEVGERHKTGPKIGRITGLDPAGPGYYGPHELRMDPDDAVLTESIRTNVGFEGTVGKVAAVEFYINGGIFQPNCLTPQYATPEVEFYIEDATLQCSHHMSHVFYTAAIRNPHCFKGYRASLGGALQSKNSSKAGFVPMGLETIDYKENRGEYFVKANLKPPYCEE